MEQLKKLIDLKSIITLVITVALVAGFFVKLIPVELFIPFASMVYTFYFTKKSSSSDTESKG